MTISKRRERMTDNTYLAAGTAAVLADLTAGLTGLADQAGDDLAGAVALVRAGASGLRTGAELMQHLPAGHEQSTVLLDQVAALAALTRRVAEAAISTPGRLPAGPTALATADLVAADAALKAAEEGLTATRGAWRPSAPNRQPAGRAAWPAARQQVRQATAALVAAV